MMQFVLDELVDVIRRDVGILKKENVLTGFASYPDLSNVVSSSSSSSVPLLLIYDGGFVFEPEILGLSYGESREEILQDFSCDGKNSEFKLSKIPVRPIVSVETPLGNKLSEYEDFVVNYKSGVLKFRSSPSKGKNNLVVRYLADGLVGESRGIRLRVKCLIDCFAKDIYECDKVVLEVIRTIMLSNEEFSQKGFTVKPLEGIRIEQPALDLLTVGTESDYSLEKGSNDARMKAPGTRKAGQKGTLKTSIQDLFGRRLTYIIETNVEAETKIPTIKEIHVKVKKPAGS
jgi:hypothetical protein